MAIRNRIKETEYIAFERYLTTHGYVRTVPHKNTDVVRFCSKSDVNHPDAVVRFRHDGILDVSGVDETIVDRFCARQHNNQIPYLLEPLTVQELKEHQDQNGSITDWVMIALNEIIHSDFETFLDLLSEKLTGTLLLTDINYEAIGCDDGNVILEVTGNTCMIFTDIDPLEES